MAKIKVPETRIIVTKPGRERIHIGIDEAFGKEVFQIRKYYFDEKSGEYKPSPKGITVPAEIGHLILKNGRAFREYLESIAEDEPADEAPKKKKRRDADEEDEAPPKKKAKKRDEEEAEPPKKKKKSSDIDSFREKQEREMAAFKKTLNKDGTIPMERFQENDKKKAVVTATKRDKDKKGPVKIELDEEDRPDPETRKRKSGFESSDDDEDAEVPRKKKKSKKNRK